MNRLAMAIALLAAFPGAGNAQPDRDELPPCEKFIDCDCSSIEAGLLSGPWRDDCRSCQQRLVDACREIYTSSGNLWAALTHGGYCETKCSVTGPDPYPPAPESLGGWSPGEGVPEPAVMELLCPFGSRPVVEVADGMTWYGCRDAAGTPVGPWTAIGPDAGALAERFYGEDGEILNEGEAR